MNMGWLANRVDGGRGNPRVRGRLRAGNARMISIFYRFL